MPLKAAPRMGLKSNPLPLSERLRTLESIFACSCTQKCFFSSIGDNPKVSSVPERQNRARSISACRPGPTMVSMVSDDAPGLWKVTREVAPGPGVMRIVHCFESNGTAGGKNGSMPSLALSATKFCAPCGTLQQLHFELPLQISHPTAQRWKRNSEPSRCRRETARLDDPHKHASGIQIHGAWPTIFERPIVNGAYSLPYPISLPWPPDCLASTR